MSVQFHDDGEKELGPTVAALSLGSPSLMKFRPKFKWKDFPVEKLTKTYKIVLEVPMKHGDIMVMHGKAIQRYYEVCLSVFAAFSSVLRFVFLHLYLLLFRLAVFFPGFPSGFPSASSSDFSSDAC
jgi:hypothetical protein